MTSQLKSNAQLIASDALNRGLAGWNPDLEYGIGIQSARQHFRRFYQNITRKAYAPGQPRQDEYNSAHLSGRSTENQ
jgi:hypothetical protein